MNHKVELSDTLSLNPPATMLAITRAVDQAAQDLREKHADDLTLVPEWSPLEAALPEPEWGGWMFMNRNADPVPTLAGQPGPGEIISYKHGITRKGLHLDARGMAWIPHWGDLLARPETTRWEGPVPAEMVLHERGHYLMLADLGAEPGTAYDEDYIAARNTRLREAGYTVIDGRI